MSPMIRGLVGEKMSSSVETSKIDLTNSPEEVKKRINKAEMSEGDSNNGVVALLKYLIFILKNDKGEKFIVNRDKKYGGDLEYSSYGDLERDFLAKKLHPMDLKNAVADEINILLKNFRENKKLRELHKRAYG